MIVNDSHAIVLGGSDNSVHAINGGNVVVLLEDGLNIKAINE